MNRQEAHIASLIEEDHRQLKQAINALIEETDRRVAPEAFPGWKLAFLQRLRDFQNQLLKHFDLEEADDGFLDDVLRLAPQFRRTVGQLEDEHRKLIADVDHLVSVVKDLDGAASARLPRVRERIRTLIAAFEAHESMEEHLIQSIYYQDYGVRD